MKVTKLLRWSFWAGGLFDGFIIRTAWKGEGHCTRVALAHLILQNFHLFRGKRRSSLSVWMSANGWVKFNELHWFVQILIEIRIFSADYECETVSLSCLRLNLSLSLRLSVVWKQTACRCTIRSRIWLSFSSTARRECSRCRVGTSCILDFSLLKRFWIFMFTLFIARSGYTLLL